MRFSRRSVLKTAIILTCLGPVSNTALADASPTLEAGGVVFSSAPDEPSYIAYKFSCGEDPYRACTAQVSATVEMRSSVGPLPRTDWFNGPHEMIWGVGSMVVPSGLILSDVETGKLWRFRAARLFCHSPLPDEIANTTITNKVQADITFYPDRTTRTIHDTHVTSYFCGIPPS